MLKYILFGAVAALIIGFVVYTAIRNGKIRKNGVEADAVVSRIEEEQTVSSEDGVDYTYTHYVTYRNPQGDPIISWKKVLSTLSTCSAGHKRKCALRSFI